MTGNEYKLRVAKYVISAYGPRGVDVFDEVTIGTSLLGKPRRIDLLLRERDSKAALAIECKFQDSAGTVDEKIPHALQDLASLRMPAVMVYAGGGFSEGVLHLLRASSLAAFCMPDESLKPLPRQRAAEAFHSGTWQLDHVLAQSFGWWDVIIGDRKPMAI